MSTKRKVPTPKPKKINKIPQFIGEELIVQIIKTLLVECYTYHNINLRNLDPVSIHDAQISVLEISDYIGKALVDYEYEITAYVKDSRISDRYINMLHNLVKLIYDEGEENA